MSIGINGASCNSFLFFVRFVINIDSEEILHFCLKGGNIFLFNRFIKLSGKQTAAQEHAKAVNCSKHIHGVGILEVSIYKRAETRSSAHSDTNNDFNIGDVLHKLVTECVTNDSVAGNLQKDITLTLEES